MHQLLSQAPRADTAAISTILMDACDEPLRNKATRIAQHVLTHVPGMAEQRGDIMMTTLARYKEQSYVVCSSHEITVLFMGKHAFVLARDDGSVPWAISARMYMPDMGYFKGRVRIDNGLSEQLLEYVELLMEAERRAGEVALEYAGEEEPCHAPTP